jgi:hypothetical protein
MRGSTDLTSAAAAAYRHNAVPTAARALSSVTAMLVVRAQPKSYKIVPGRASL